MTDKHPDLRHSPFNETSKLGNTHDMVYDIHEIGTETYNLSTTSPESTSQPSFADFSGQKSPSLEILSALSSIANNNRDVSVDSLNQVEDWRGKTTQDIPTSQILPLKHSRPNYLDSCPDWSTDNVKSAIGLPLIRNGNLCDPVVIDKQTIVVHETCAFDSILQIVVDSRCMNHIILR